MTPQTPATPRNNRQLSLLQYPLLCAAILLAGCVDSADTASSFCNRTEQVVQAILAQTPDAASCEEITETHLQAITTLDLSGQSITELQAGDFSGLTNLSSLNLGDNPIFSELPNLSELNLGDKQLALTLPAPSPLANFETWGAVVENSELSALEDYLRENYFQEDYAPEIIELFEDPRYRLDVIKKIFAEHQRMRGGDGITTTPLGAVFEGNSIEAQKLRAALGLLEDSFNQLEDSGDLLNLMDQADLQNIRSFTLPFPDQKNQQPALKEQEQDEAK